MYAIRSYYEGFLGGHGLGLDDLLAVRVLGDLRDDGVGLDSVLGEMDVNPGGLGLGPEFLVERARVLSGRVLGVGDVLDRNNFV